MESDDLIAQRLTPWRRVVEFVLGRVDVWTHSDPEYDFARRLRSGHGIFGPVPLIGDCLNLDAGRDCATLVYWDRERTPLHGDAVFWEDNRSERQHLTLHDGARIPIGATSKWLLIDDFGRRWMACRNGAALQASWFNPIAVAVRIERYIRVPALHRQATTDLRADLERKRASGWGTGWYRWFESDCPTPQTALDELNRLQKLRMEVRGKAALVAASRSAVA